MRIDTVNIHFNQPSAKATAALQALLRTSAQAPTAAAPDPTDMPAIGDPWPGICGIYAGLSRGENGDADAHLVLLTAKPSGKLDWKAATAWAEALGDGARMPTRDESALLYAHLRDQFLEGWHWTSTQYSESNAWVQYVGNGGQVYDGKEYEGHARAVRRFPA